MADNNKMNIIEALVKLRNDLKLWVANNLRVKLDKNLGAEESGKVLAVDENGDVVTVENNFITVDTELSSTSTNPVQNKVVDTAISGIVNDLIGGTPVSEQISTAISKIDYPVDSVNGRTGSVQLTATDVGALPDTTPIPSVDGLATEQFVTDAIADAAYSLPSATPDVLGGVKVGSGLKINNGVLAADVIDNLISTSTTQALSAAQGKALSEAINSITTDLGNLGGGDMLKATYDKNNDGIIDNAARLEGYAASYFATASDLNTLIGDTSVSEQINNALVEAKLDASNKDAVILYEAQQGINAALNEAKEDASNKVAVALAEVQKIIPQVTTADNGKFLRVVDGVWAATTVNNAEGVSF